MVDDYDDEDVDACLSGAICVSVSPIAMTFEFVGTRYVFHSDSPIVSIDSLSCAKENRVPCMCPRNRYDALKEQPLRAVYALESISRPSLLKDESFFEKNSRERSILCDHCTRPEISGAIPRCEVAQTA